MSTLYMPNSTTPPALYTGVGVTKYEQKPTPVRFVFCSLPYSALNLILSKLTGVVFFLSKKQWSRGVL